MHSTESNAAELSDQSFKPSVCSKRLTVVSGLVFAAAIALRIPACYQSFWIDELHTAWTVWGELSEVASRAHRGHQSPFYFTGLWFWKQIVGESELALRLSSVLSLAVGCAVLTIGVARWTSSLVAGAAAGSVMAIETNAIFFGTELRPYALVTLFSSIAVVCFVPLWAAKSRQTDPSMWLLFAGSILLSALSQPTSLGVLLWLPTVLAIRWYVREPAQLFKITGVDGVLLLAALIVAFTLWHVTDEVWDQRLQWTTFATATRLSQIWHIWDWTWLMIIPLGILILAVVFARVRGKSINAITSPLLCLALTSVAAAFLFWLVSRLQWLPLWHRRYFIAVLPLFACVAGGSVGAIANGCPKGWYRLSAASLASAGLVIGLAYHQSTLYRLPNYPVDLAIRGENWRGAVAWINTHAKSQDRLYLDSGLIESIALADSVPQPFTHEIPEFQREYLSYPVLGPYQVERPSLELISADFARRVSSPLAGKAYLLTRRHQSRLPELGLNGQAVGFGNLWVIVVGSPNE